MNIRKFYSLFTSALLTITLFACGEEGSGNGGSGVSYSGNTGPAAMNKSNGPLLAYNAIGISEGGSFDPTEITPPPALKNSNFHSLDTPAKAFRLLSAARTSSPNMGNFAAEPVPCVTGTISLPSNPYSGTISFNHCVLDATPGEEWEIHGTIIMSGNESSYTARYVGLRTTVGSEFDAELGGSVSISGGIDTTLNITMNTVIHDRLTDEMFKTENYEVIRTHIGGTSGTSYSTSASGRLFHSGHGYVVITTNEVFVYDEELSYYPSSGVMKLTSTGPASITVTAIDADYVRIQVDEDGSLPDECDQTVLWTNLETNTAICP